MCSCSCSFVVIAPVVISTVVPGPVVLSLLSLLFLLLLLLFIVILTVAVNLSLLIFPLYFFAVFPVVLMLLVAIPLLRRR